MWYISCMTQRDTFIRSLGIEAYLVGGAVRADILGVPRNDSDYMVRGVTLEQLHRLLDQSDKIGEIRPLMLRSGGQFGWRIGGIEISLPRTEMSTGDGRKMNVRVDPALGIADDARRRDFTFNALYKSISDPEGNVVDPTSYGLHDLERRIIRITHGDSFKDDPVRMLRALRFVSTLDADIEAITLAQMHADAHAMTGLTAKGYTSGTVYDEFSKLLMGKEPAKALRIAAETGVLAQALPELAAMVGHDPDSRYHDLTTDEHTFTAIDIASRCNVPLRVMWALLFHDSGKPATGWKGEDGKTHFYARKEDVSEDLIDAFDGHVTMDHEEYGEILWREAAERMNVSKEIREDVALLIRNHMVSVSGKFKASKVRRMRVQFGDPMLRDLLLHRACDLSAKGSARVNRNALERIAEMEKARNVALVACVPVQRKQLKITGKDVKELGLEGRLIGGCLDVILDEVVVDPSELKMSRDWQLARADSYASHIERTLRNATDV